MNILKINDGEPIALIKGNYKNDFVGIGESNVENCNHIYLVPQDLKFSLLPLENTRTKIFIAGPTGCGKTYLALEIMKNYEKMFPENDLIVITPDPDDDTFLKFSFDNLKIININDPSFEDPDLAVSPEMFHDAIVFVDDVDYLMSKDLEKRATDITRKLLGLGRHYNTSVIISSHVIMNYQKTRFIISEADYIITFPNSATNTFIDRFFKSYFSKVNSQIRDQIYSSNSRWAICRTRYPQCVLLQRQIFMLQ